MDSILEEFKEESSELIDNLEDILDDIEEDFSKKNKLNEFALLIDRIMGSSQSLSAFGFEQEEIKKLSNFSELCKQVGYRGANVNNKEFFDITVSFLFDAVESMKRLISNLGEQNQVTNISDVLVSTFISRLKWILQKFQEFNVAQTRYLMDKDLDGKIKSQDEIDSLMESFDL